MAESAAFEYAVYLIPKRRSVEREGCDITNSTDIHQLKEVYIILTLLYYLPCLVYAVCGKC